MKVLASNKACMGGTFPRVVCRSSSISRRSTTATGYGACARRRQHAAGEGPLDQWAKHDE
jgi:hypothetical protein